MQVWDLYLTSIVSSGEENVKFDKGVFYVVF